MTESDRILSSFDSGYLLRPSVDKVNLVDLANAIGNVMGAQNLPVSKNSVRIVELLGNPKHLLLVAVDGLGLSTLKRLENNGFLQHYFKMELQSVFPTSTPVAFTSLATGMWPNSHSVIGWDTYIPEVDCISTIIHFIRRSDGKNLTDMGIVPTQIYPVPSIVSRYSKNCISLLPEYLLNSEFSTYVSGGTSQQGYDKLAQATASAVTRIRESAEPTFTYLYTPLYDAAAHRYGAYHMKSMATANHIELAIKCLVESLPAGVTVVLTSDHGLLDATEDITHYIDANDVLITCLQNEPWGDHRAVNFRVADGQELRFEELFYRKFSNNFFLLTIDQIDELEVYGPGRLSPVTRSRLGTHIAISTGRDVLRYPVSTKRPRQPMVSYHSGLSANEMLVPLVILKT